MTTTDQERVERLLCRCLLYLNSPHFETLLKQELQKLLKEVRTEVILVQTQEGPKIAVDFR